MKHLSPEVICEGQTPFITCTAVCDRQQKLLADKDKLTAFLPQHQGFTQVGSCLTCKH